MPVSALETSREIARPITPITSSRAPAKLAEAQIMNPIAISAAEGSTPKRKTAPRGGPAGDLREALASYGQAVAGAGIAPVEDHVGGGRQPDAEVEADHRQRAAERRLAVLDQVEAWPDDDRRR